MATCFVDYGQVFNAKSAASNTSATRGINGQWLPIGSTPGATCTIISGTVTPTTRPDTLVSAPVSYHGYATDTGYVQFSFTSRVDKLYELTVNSLTGTLAGTAVLQGSRDNVTWYAITGSTTYCASCKGASATLSGSGTTKYQWSEPIGADIYQYHQFSVILSGTCTATFSGIQTTAY